MLVHEGPTADASLVPQDGLALSCAAEEASEAPKFHTQAAHEALHVVTVHPWLVSVHGTRRAFQLLGVRLPTANLPRSAATLRHAVHVGLGRPLGRLAELKHVVVELEQLGGLAKSLTLGIPSVLASTDDGPRHVLLTLGAHDAPADALAGPLLVAVDAPTMSRAPSPRQRVREDGPMALLRTVIVQDVNAHLLPVVLGHDVRRSSLPRPPVASSPHAQDVRDS